MTYAHFHHMSTGYVEGTIPPVFRESAKRPIAACGSDSRLKLDRRKTLSNQAAEARAVCRARGYLGFDIRADRTSRPYSDPDILRKLELLD